MVNEDEDKNLEVAYHRFNPRLRIRPDLTFHWREGKNYTNRSLYNDNGKYIWLKNNVKNIYVMCREYQFLKIDKRN